MAQVPNTASICAGQCSGQAGQRGDLPPSLGASPATALGGLCLCAQKAPSSNVGITFIHCNVKLRSFGGQVILI